jgi:hypothetical protein
MSTRRTHHLSKLVLIPALAASIALSGCTAQPSHMNKPGIPQPVMPDNGVSLSMLPAAPRQLDPVVFTVEVRDHDHGSSPMDADKVSVELSMSEMAMPPNIVTMTRTAVGKYTGTGKFTMPGRWTAKTQVDAPGKNIGMASIITNVSP